MFSFHSLYILHRVQEGWSKYWYQHVACEYVATSRGTPDTSTGFPLDRAAAFVSGKRHPCWRHVGTLQRTESALLRSALRMSCDEQKHSDVAHHLAVCARLPAVAIVFIWSAMSLRAVTPTCICGAWRATAQYSAEWPVNAAALTAGLTMPVLTVKAAARDCFKV